MATEKDKKLLEIEALAAHKELTFEEFRKAAQESNQVKEKFDSITRSVHSLGREDLRRAIKTDAGSDLSWSDYMPGAVTLEQARQITDEASNAQARHAPSKIGFFGKQEKAPIVTDKMEETTPKPPRSRS